MKGKKFLLLFLALLLPICIFVFLRMFGKNQFDVPALFVESVPDHTSGCQGVYSLPYVVADSTFDRLGIKRDSLICIFFPAREEVNGLHRVKDKYASSALSWRILDPNENEQIRTCIFMLKEPFNVALVDKEGIIRGQYASSQRDEIDRLITEIEILLIK